MDLERIQELREEEADANSFYSDWLSDNLYELRDTFIEENQDLFNQYCKDCFNEYMNNR